MRFRLQTILDILTPCICSYSNLLINHELEMQKRSRSLIKPENGFSRLLPHSSVLRAHNELRLGFKCSNDRIPRLNFPLLRPPSHSRAVARYFNKYQQETSTEIHCSSRDIHRQVWKVVTLTRIQTCVLCKF